MSVEKTIKIKLDTSDAVNDLKKIRSEIDITYAELRKTTPIELDGTKAKNVLKNLDTDINSSAKNTEQIGKNAENSVGGFKKLTISAKMFGTALKATGIGLVIGAFVKLQEALSKNQQVMDAVNIALETVSITFQQVVGKIVEKGQKLLGFFKKIGTIVKKFVTQDLDGLTSSYEENNIQVETAIQKNRRLAKEMIELRKTVKLAEAEQRLLQLTYQKEAEIQRQVRDDISLTIEERIKANTKLGTILNKQFEDERRIALQKIELAEKELSKNKENIDLQVALINSKTELADLDERITGQRSEQLINLKSLEQEQIDAIQTKLDLEQKAADDLLALKEKEAADLKAITDKKTADELKATQDKIAMNKAMEISGAQTILSALGQLAGEGTKLAKATAVSSILINTAQGVSAAIKAGAGLVFPANLGAIATGVGSVLSGIASAKSILAKVPGGTENLDSEVDLEPEQIQEPQVGGIQGIASTLLPNINNTNTNQQPIQAYVIENDISDAQALQEELEIQATL